MPATTGPRSPRAGRIGGLRPEIQALRALAVALVVVYHLAPAALPGGYVGVDVFFVISGFLITGHLLREGDRTGRIDLPAFWANRARRILPAALVTLAVVVLAALALLPRTVAAETGGTAVWAALSAANWLFAAQSIDYQAQSPDASPLEHFWSLGVEEQFYLLWPLLVLLALVAARRRPRIAVRVLFSVVLATSLAFGIVFTFSGSQAAYFITPTRMWELAAGGLLAATLADRQLPRPAALLLQAGGLAALVTGAVLFTDATPMPGLAALLPVTGALAVIAGGRTPVLGRLLAVRPVQALGDRSYSLYLWHWPLIVFVRLLAGGEPDPLGLLGVAALALLLASLSYAFVEQPLRRRRIVRPARAVAFGLAAVVATCALVQVPIATDRAASAAAASARRALLEEAAADEAAHALGYPALLRTGAATWSREPHTVVPDPATAGSDQPPGGCSTGPQSTTSKICWSGDAKSDTVVALVGDSHAVQWLGALDALAKQEHWRLLSILHNSCPYSLTPRPFELQGHSRCTQAVRASLPLLTRYHVRALVTSAYRTAYAGDTAKGVAGYAAMWTRLEHEGIRVVALGDIPQPAASPTTADCAAGGDPAACGVPRSTALAVPDPLRAAAARAHVPFVDPADAFCRATWCPGVIGNVLAYRDDNHASNTYVETALPWLRRTVVPVLQRALKSSADPS